MGNIDRDTPMLLPPDLRDGVPQDDMVHFVIEAVEGMPLSTLKVNRRGRGAEQYPPKMMLALLIYCYANGIFSSRRIERATYRDVAVRFLSGDTHPDHDTIGTFRRENFEAVAPAFLEVRQRARALGVLKVGTVSVDGTYVAANASKDNNVRYDRAGELDQPLQQDITDLLAKAERSDRREADDGPSIPRELARLREKMPPARREREARAKARAEAEQAEYEKKKRDRAPRSGSCKGRHLKPPPDTPDDHEPTNLTDADRRLLRKSQREGYTPSYNSPAAVDAEGSQLILAGHVSTCASDANALEPAVAGVTESVGPPSSVLADRGYVNAEALDRLEEAGVDRYVAVSREASPSPRRYDYRPTSVTEKPPKVVKASRLLAMQEKLRTEVGRAWYALRKHTVEPVFGIIKSVMGFRQFLLRGLEKVSGEWALVCLAYNVKHLGALKTA